MPAPKVLDVVKGLGAVKSLKAMNLREVVAAAKGKRLHARTRSPIGIDLGSRLVKAVQFGRERWGLDNDEVALADVIVSAPVNPAFASLNIAQAVLLVGYEWYKVEAASIGQATPELPAIAVPGLRAPDTRPATKDELEGFFRHLEEELDQAGFYKTSEKKPGMVRNMRNLFLRAALTEQEVRSLRGMVASLSHGRAKRER